MTDYRAPLRDMQFLLYEVFGIEQEWSRLAGMEELNRELADALLEEAARLTETLIAPLSRPGDEAGVRFEDGKVFTPEGFKPAWQTYRAGGWIGFAGDPAYGGQGMPRTLTLMVEEMMHSASNAFCMYSILTSGLALALKSHGSDALKQRFLPLLYSGECAGAMCLTESHSGTDLGLLRTRAEPSGDATYRITGTKIFITGGEQDLTDNILYLVLARLPDAPEGSAGISMFLVPKYKLRDDNSPGEANGVSCGSIEHKMGIHASSTCVINFDGAEGWLVGEVNKGLKAMFTMMNYERLSVGLQGLGCSELAYQKSVAYARERLQSRAPAGAVCPDKPADPIIAQPDVRRMLLTQKALIEAGRAFCVYAGLQLDRARYGTEEGRLRARQLSALLTPVGKAFLSDRGLECCLEGQMVFGGHGYIREWGMEQLVRDARIAQIYEGTNGIQALDLVKRRVQANGGEHVGWVLADIREFISVHGNALGDYSGLLAAATDRLESVTAGLVAAGEVDANAGPAAAVDYLAQFGYVLYGWMWARLLVAAAAHDPDEAGGYYAFRRQLADFYFRRLLPRARLHAQAVESGAASLMTPSMDAF